jgi:hypothetical protein
MELLEDEDVEFPRCFLGAHVVIAKRTVRASKIGRGSLPNIVYRTRCLSRQETTEKFE